MALGGCPGSQPYTQFGSLVVPVWLSQGPVGGGERLKWGDHPVELPELSFSPTPIIPRKEPPLHSPNSQPRGEEGWGQPSFSQAGKTGCAWPGGKGGSWKRGEREGGSRF